MRMHFHVVLKVASASVVLGFSIPRKGGQQVDTDMHYLAVNDVRKDYLPDFPFFSYVKLLKGTHFYYYMYNLCDNFPIHVVEIIF
jgi:hypothetical protein